MSSKEIEKLSDQMKELIISNLSNWPLSQSVYADFLISQERLTLPGLAVLTGTWRIREACDLFCYMMYHDTSVGGVIDCEYCIDGNPDERFSYTIMPSLTVSPFSNVPPVHVKKEFWFQITNTNPAPVSTALTILWYRVKEENWKMLHGLYWKYLGMLPR